MRILIVSEEISDNVFSRLKRVLQPAHEVVNFDLYRESTPLNKLAPARGLLNQAWLALARLTNSYEYERGNRKLIEFVRDWQPDWIIVLRLREVHPQTIAEIRSFSKAVISGWFLDSIARFGREFMLAADYDGLFLTDRFVVERFRQFLGNERIFFLPLCGDPELHRPVTLTLAEQRRYGCDVVLFGNMYYSRLRTLEVLAGCDLKIYGGWPDWATHPLKSYWQGRPILGEEKTKAISAAKIVVNTVHFSALDAVNKRVFEVASMGTFQLAQAPGLDGLFTEDEIVRFETPTELCEKIEYYLAHPDERAAIAARARQRVLREHTYEHRANEMMEILGLRAK